MWNRREALAWMGSAAWGAARVGEQAVWGADPATPPLRLAVVTTLWNYRSHAWHMAERFLHGYPRRGAWHRPPIRVVSAYVDQRPDGDLSAQRAAEFGFKIYPKVDEALRQGGAKLDVDAVLLIGEHGNYPVNKIGQKQYPRYELFKQIVDVFRADGRSTPVFNDKHLSWNFDWAQQMVAWSKELKFPFLAGSSLPVTWRMPAIDLPSDARVDEALVVAHGPLDIYDFHALETLQCMVERRAGGETGVAAVQALRGDAVWKAIAAGDFARGGLDLRLFEACLARSHSLAQPESFSHRYPTVEQMRTMAKDPVAYRIEYRDGLKATLLMLNGLVEDLTFAARFANGERLSTLFHLPPNPNVVYSAALMAQVERMIRAGQAPYPVERTLLTSGLVTACLQSLADGQQRQETPQLAVRYEASRESHFDRE